MNDSTTSSTLYDNNMYLLQPPASSRSPVFSLESMRTQLQDAGMNNTFNELYFVLKYPLEGIDSTSKPHSTNSPKIHQGTSPSETNYTNYAHDLAYIKAIQPPSLNPLSRLVHIWATQPSTD